MSHAMYVSILFPTIVFLELLILCVFFEKIYRFDAGDRSGTLMTQRYALSGGIICRCR